MKTVAKFILSCAFLLSLSSIASASETGSPQAVSVKIYEFWVSTSPDCTALTRVFNDTNPSYQNMVGGPTFGEIDIPNGIYTCIAWKMSDIISLVPDFTSDPPSSCVQGQTYTRDLFRAPDITISPTGVQTAASAGDPDDLLEDFMWVYLSITGDNDDAVTIPTEPGDLQNVYEVDQTNEAVLVTDFTNGIHDTGTECSPEVVTFDFRYDNQN